MVSVKSVRILCVTYVPYIYEGTHAHHYVWLTSFIVVTCKRAHSHSIICRSEWCTYTVHILARTHSHMHITTLNTTMRKRINDNCEKGRPFFYSSQKEKRYRNEHAYATSSGRVVAIYHSILRVCNRFVHLIYLSFI